MEKFTLVVAGVVIAAAVWLRMPYGTALPVVLYVALVTPALVAADLAWRRLPNALTYPGLALVAVVGTNSMRFGALVAAGCLTALSAGGAVGMGDVKLGVVAGGALGAYSPASVVITGGVAVVVGGVMAFVATFEHERAGPATVALGPALLAGFWVAYAVAT